MGSGDELPQLPMTESPHLHSLPASQKKHEAMLERLSNLHQSRLNQSTSRKSAGDHPPFESTSSFLATFSQRKQSIESSLDRCRNVSDPSLKSYLKAELEGISASITDLEGFVSEKSYFLPSYDVRSSLKTITDLREAMESLNAEIQPRKKFSFHNKPGKADSAKKVADFDASSVEGSVLLPSTSISVHDSPGFRHQSNVILDKEFGFLECGDFTISDLESCEVRLRGCLRALYVHRVKNCRIYTGPVTGSILIEEVEDGVFMLASHQIRIHQAKRTDFYIRVRSRPIIEDCSEVRFAPHRMVYEGIEKDLNDAGLGEENGNWANVDDFKWLRAVQSPNWCLVPEGEWTDMVNLSGFEAKNGDM